MINFLLPGALQAADSAYYPASPLQPVGRPKAEPQPAYSPGQPIPTIVAEPPKPSPAPTPSAQVEAPPITCSEACSGGRVGKILFELRGGRIGAESAIEIEGEKLELRAYSAECPAREGKLRESFPESIPDGCVFVFMLPAARAKNRQALRCLGGKVGMSGFRCDDSSSAPGSIGPSELSREQGEL